MSAFAGFLIKLSLLPLILLSPYSARAGCREKISLLKAFTLGQHARNLKFLFDEQYGDAQRIFEKEWAPLLADEKVNGHSAAVEQAQGLKKTLDQAAAPHREAQKEYEDYLLHMDSVIAQNEARRMGQTEPSAPRPKSTPVRKPFMPPRFIDYNHTEKEERGRNGTTD